MQSCVSDVSLFSTHTQASSSSRPGLAAGLGVETGVEEEAAAFLGVETSSLAAMPVIWVKTLLSFWLRSSLPTVWLCRQLATQIEIERK